MSNNKVIPVKVALRCRPMSPRELGDGCQMCLRFVPGESQVILGVDKAFTYDYVFDPGSEQQDVYENAVSHLVKGIFKGYNATVLAYGQTGSGKTHSMGGGWGEHSGTEDEVGIIPRVIKELFDGIENAKDNFSFVVRVSYLELYKETLIDLLTPRTEQDTEGVIIREDPNGGIKLTGLLVKDVSDEADLLSLLAKGALSRTTGATAMNSVSSRSHAIFTIHIERTSKLDSNDFIKAKFHLVDLAGSERAKRTQAQGDRFKEGVNINLGLLALGNVISALGDESQKRNHIPYRDSKLTRLLQDSLGGNSLTVMIACVSPADSNMEETLSTMRYADRARKIKNKPIINRDPHAAEILRLKQLVQSLQSGGATIGSSNNGDFEDTRQLREKITNLMEENLRLSRELHDSVDQSTHMCERLIVAETARDSLKEKLERLREKTGLSLTMMLNRTEPGEEREEGEGEGGKSRAEHVSLLQELCEEMEDIGKQNVVALSDILEEELLHGASTTPGGSSSDLPLSPDGTPDSALQDHALRQAKLSRELQGLNEMLEKKERLASQMLQNDDQMNTMRVQYEKTMKDLEKEVQQLHKERDDLVSALTVTKSNPALSKVSEQRRKRVQELGGQITDMKRKILEQGKMLKVKELSVRQCEKLNQEIQAMKRQRVKLMKHMKEDSDNFRRWKLTKEKEVAQLKAKDRKRQVEMTKLELRHERQQVVMRRKAEEAALANKRLKEALAQQKLAADERRDRLAKKDMSGIGARVRKWLSQELEVLVSIAEAKRHLQEVINDRKELNKQRQECEARLALDPPSKRSLLNDSSTHDTDASHQDLRDEMTRLEQEVELRSVQISELQQKLMDANQDEKAKSRWDNVHTMVEAKCGLKWLLTVAVEAKVELAHKMSELQQARDHVSEAMEQGEEAQTSIGQLRLTHDDQMTTLRQEYERKILFLLRQLKTSDLTHGNVGVTDTELKERLEFQEGEIERLSSLQDLLDKKKNECATLKKELTVAAYTGDVVKTPLMPRVDLNKQTEARTPVLYDDTDEEEEEEEDDSIWDDCKDPDYVQTPLMMRRRALLKKKSVAAPPTGPRDSGCGCHGKCKTKQCRCRKFGNHCGATCRCTEAQCVNRERQEPVSTTSDDTQQTMDSTFCISGRDESGASTGDTSAETLNPPRPVRSAWEKRSGNFTLPPMTLATEGVDSSDEKENHGKSRKRRIGQLFDNFLE